MFADRPSPNKQENLRAQCNRKLTFIFSQRGQTLKHEAPYFLKYFFLKSQGQNPIFNVKLIILGNIAK